MPRVSAIAKIDLALIQPVERPRPLADLTAEQAEEWARVVNALPADWFRPETLGLLAQYCRHVVAARRVAQLITQAEGEDDLDIREYDRLLAAQEREGRAMSSLATRMRMTQQSTYTADKTKGKVRGPKAKPWDE